MKKKMKHAKKKSMGKRIAIGILTVVLLLNAAFAGINIYYYCSTEKLITDSMKEAEEIAEKSQVSDFIPNKPSYIYDDSGTLLAKLSRGQTSKYLEYDKIPEQAVQAFVAIEDRSFWENDGYDLKAIARAALNYIATGGSLSQGGSTITQQLSKMVYLTREKTLERKVKEIFLSYHLTRKYSKEQVMEFYINNCCFANNIYGIEDAAKTYFGKSASKLSLSQTAYLCAIPNRPEYYNPYDNPDNAIPRRNKILDDMRECGYISDKECQEAKEEKITIAKKKKGKIYDYATTYAISCAVKFLMKENGFLFEYHWEKMDDYKEYQKRYEEAYASAEEKLYTGGYTIHTSINLEKQNRMQEILKENLSFNTKKNKQTGTYNLQGAMTVIDNSTHKVTAIIGGREASSDTYSLNRAFQSPRQPGSTIKPLIVYAPALEMEAYPYTTIYNIDVQRAYENPDEIENMTGREVTLRNAVEQSLNGCAIYVYNYVGIQKGLRKLQDMKFQKIVPSDYNLSSGLGGLTYGTTTAEMANAYSTLANEGTYTEADCIVSIKNDFGKEIYEQPEGIEVYDADAVYEMTDILKGVLRNGTAKNLYWYSWTNTEAAAKTGTTNDTRDGWFCGYTKDYTISVWVGNDDNAVVSNLYGGTYPGRIWRSAMLEMIKGKERTTLN